LSFFFLQDCFAGIEVLLAPTPFMESDPSGEHFQEPVRAVSPTSVDWTLFAVKQVAFGRRDTPVSEANI